MLFRITRVFEILAIISCVHCIYGKRVKFTIHFILLHIGILTLLECIDYFQLPGVLSLFSFVFIYAYCKGVFKKTWMETFINVILHVVLLTTVEFLSALLVSVCIVEDVAIRNLVITIIVFLCCNFVLPKIFPEGIGSHVLQTNRNVRLFLGLVIIVILLLLLQSKLARGINVSLFIFAVPFAIVIVWMLHKWEFSQMSVERMEKEMQVKEAMQDNYDKLLEDVRLRQHEYKNHLAAIAATHYTCKTYDNLVQAQDAYCQKIEEENKYNHLLQINNRVLTGFLYRKFQEIETKGISVEYEVDASVGELAIPTYYLVEILGILLDNAAEAAKSEEKQIVQFAATEKEAGIMFVVKNHAPYRSYQDIERMFEKGVTDKGAGRGLGLYHAKKLCQEWKSDLYCRCMEIEQKNWMEFGVYFNKADRD